MLPTSIHRRTYIIVSIVVSIPLILWAFVNANRTYTLLQYAVKQELITAATTLEQRIPASYEQLLKSDDMLHSSSEEKREALNRHLQPIVNEVAKNYPSFGLGYYSPELNIVALAPLNTERLGAKAHLLSLKVYETKKMDIAYLDSGVTRDEQPLMAVNYPLYYGGQLIGHVWANYKMDDLNRQYYFVILKYLGLIFLLWICVLLIIHWVFGRMEKALHELADQVKNGSYNPNKLVEFPQLIPVLNTILGLYKDKEKAMEEIAKLDRLNLVSQMAAGVAHEVRNPLTVIKGFLQYFQKKELTTTTQDQYKLILEELSRVESIISDFLSLAKSKVTQQKLCNLNYLLEGIYPLLSAQALKQGIELKFQLDSRLPDCLINDKEIIQLVLNLSRNAIDAMSKHGNLTIQTQLDGMEIILLISDTGCGIPQEILKDIFNPFYTTKDNGTGLGLAICASIVNRHSGTITAQSIENVGTTFRVAIPA